LDVAVVGICRVAGICAVFVARVAGALAIEAVLVIVAVVLLGEPEFEVVFDLVCSGVGALTIIGFCFFLA